MTPGIQPFTSSAAPLGQLSATDRRRTPTHTRTEPGASRRILVIDADRERRWLLTDVVVRAGDQAEVAGSGADAVALLQDGEAKLPAVLVGGLLDGTRRGFVSWARPRFPELAIVALADDAGEATALYRAGADIVTTAPIDPDLLGAKLGAALRRSARTTQG